MLSNSAQKLHAIPNTTSRRRPVILERFIQTEKKAPAAKLTPGIVETQIGAGRFIEEYTQPGAATWLPYLEEFCFNVVISRLQVEESNAAKELVPCNREAVFYF